MMFGLTSAHAAGSIAMVMVGMNILVGKNTYLVDDDMLNGVVIMILCTCIISSLLTDWSSRMIVLRDKELPEAEDEKSANDEKILIPVRYPEYADNLMSLAFLVRNQKLNRGLVCLNVVYEDKDMRYNQEQGKRLLEHCSQIAAATDVLTQTQVRIAANIANGIKHKEQQQRRHTHHSVCRSTEPPQEHLPLPLGRTHKLVQGEALRQRLRDWQGKGRRQV